MIRPTEPDDQRRVAQVTEIVDQLRSTFKPRDLLFDRIDRVVFSLDNPEIPPGYEGIAKIVKSPLALHMTNTITAALTVNPQKVQFQPAGIGDAAQTNATLREHFFEASWERQEDEANAPLLRQFFWNIVAKGTGVLKTLERSKKAWARYGEQYRTLVTKLREDGTYAYDPDATDRLLNARADEMKRNAPYPITTANLPPETVYWLQTEDGHTAVAEVKEVPYYDALARYDLALDRSGVVVPQAGGLGRPEWSRVMGKAKTLKMVELWDWRTCTSLLIGPGQEHRNGVYGSGGRSIGRGTVARVYRHGYGDPVTKTLSGPYFISFGTTTGSRLPEREMLGVLTPFLDLFPALDRKLTIQETNAILYGLGMFKTVSKNRTGNGRPPPPPGSDGLPAGEEAEPIKPGYVYPDDIAAMDAPQGGVDLDKAIATNRGFLELALPSILQGVVDATESGYELNQAAYLARLQFNPTIGNAQRTLGRRVGFESRLIEEKIREPVWCWGEPPPAGKRKRQAAAGWLRMAPEDLNGVHRYKVRLEPETPSNEILSIRANVEKEQAGFQAKSDAIEALGGDASEVERKRLLEEYKALPETKQRVFQRADQLLGMKLAAKQQSADAASAQLDGAAGALPAPDQGGGFANGAPDVYAPGQNLPVVPGPAEAGGLPAVPANGPGGIQNPPQNAEPLPGQAGA